MQQDHEASHGARSRRATPTDYPEDRFDGIPRSGRIGAHRVTAQPRIAWHFVLGGLIGAVLLTTIGIVGVTLAGNAGKLPTQTPPGTTAGTAKVKPALNPDATVVLLDGASPDGAIAQRLATTITTEKLGVVMFAGPASNSEVEISAVFYPDAGDEAAALGLAKELGGVSSYLSQDYAEYDAQLVVLIGADYAGPGKTAEE